MFLLVLFILAGVILYFIINTFIIYGITDFTSHKSYTSDYTEGSGRLNIDFTISYDSENDFYGELILQTSSTGNVVDVGIVNCSYQVFVDEEFRLSRVDDFLEPSTYYRERFFVVGIYQNSLTICEGYAVVKFNVDGVVQDEIIDFEITILMPFDFNQRFFEHDLTAVWIEIILIISLIVVIGLMSLVLKTREYKVDYPEKMKKRDNEFWDYIQKKAENQREE